MNKFQIYFTYAGLSIIAIGLAALMLFSCSGCTIEQNKENSQLNAPTNDGPNSRPLWWINTPTVIPEQKY